MAFKKKLNQRTGEWIVGSWFATPHTLNFDNFVESFGIACPKIIYISNVYSFWHIKNIRHSSSIYFQAKSSKKSSWAENTCESLNWWVSYWKIKSQHRKLHEYSSFFPPYCMHYIHTKTFDNQPPRGLVV